MINVALRTIHFNALYNSFGYFIANLSCLTDWRDSVFRNLYVAEGAEIRERLADKGYRNGGDRAAEARGRKSVLRLPSSGQALTTCRNNPNGGYPAKPIIRGSDSVEKPYNFA